MTLKKDYYNVILLVFALLFIVNIGENYFIYEKIQKNIQINIDAIDDINKTIEKLEKNIVSMAVKLDDLEDVTDTLYSNYASRQYLLNNLENNVEYIDDRLDNLEKELDLIDKRNSENLGKISDFEDHIEDLYSEIGVKTGNKLYLDNRIWYEYNGTLALKELGIYSKEPSIAAGVVTIDQGMNTTIMVTTFTWQYDINQYLSSNIDFINNEMESILEENGFENIERIRTEKIAYNEHLISISIFKGDISGEEIYCKIAYWYCSSQKRVYSFMVLTDTFTDVDSIFNNNLNNFRCHR